MTNKQLNWLIGAIEQHSINKKAGKYDICMGILICEDIGMDSLTKDRIVEYYKKRFNTPETLSICKELETDLEYYRSKLDK